MISFTLGKPPLKNATVTIEEKDHDAFAERDAEGNIEITVDIFEPDDGEAVSVCLHKEGDGRYEGFIHLQDGSPVFRAG